jgi:hypothetical protein
MNERFNLNHLERVLGKHVLIELTTLDHHEQVLDRQEMYGQIARVSESQGLVVKLIPSGDDFILPPDLDILEPAGDIATGEATGTVREATPDFIVRRSIHNPPPEMQVPPLVKTTGGPAVRKV